MKQTIISWINYGLIIFLGIFCRWILLNSSYQKAIENRVEISTPFTSWQRIKEGVHLHNLNISPYTGDTFHEQPLFLWFYAHLLSLANVWINLIFITTDIVTAILLSKSIPNQLKTLISLENNSIVHLKPISDAALLVIPNPIKTSFYVLSLYLLNPLSLMIVAAKSSAIFSNLFIATCLWSSTKKWRMTACFFGALLTYQSLHYVSIFIASTLIIELQRSLRADKQIIIYDLKSILCSLSIYFIDLIFLFGVSYLLNDHNWSFLNSTYWYNLTVSDLTPNIGFYWYFFTEMFDHFYDFFLAIFQLNAFIYTIPFALALRKNPFILFFVYLILISLFKPYPSISDFTIYIFLLPQWRHFFPLMRLGLLLSCVFACCIVLAPIMWQMWIVLGTANSNFYFGVTLAYNAAQILLLVDLLYAFTKRQFFLDIGTTKDEKGQPLVSELTH